MYNLQWSRKELSPHKLGMFGEYYAKMALTSYGMSIYSSEVDDHGIDFVAETQKGFMKFQVKTIRDSTSYVFMKKAHFDVSDDSLHLILITLVDGKHPTLYVLPTRLWRNIDTVSRLFVYRASYPKPEYGLNLSTKNMPLLEQYKLENIIETMM